MMSKELIVNEIHKNARRKFQRRRVLQIGINDTWQADLVEMIPHSSQNSGYKYILTIIDIFSKYAHAIALKNKTASCVTSAMRTVIEKSKEAPKNIHTDEGKEFFNREFHNLMKQNKINHYHTYSSMKASIIERFNRTLKSVMYKKFSLNGNYKWVSLLPMLVNYYNNSVHRTIKMKPKDVSVNDEARLLSIYNKLEENVKVRRKIDLKLGDHVRLSKVKGLFEKNYIPNWSTELFQIKKIAKTKPTTYILNDLNGEQILGCFYREELQKTNEINDYLIEKIIRQEKGRILVKWLGIDETSWISKKDLL